MTREAKLIQEESVIIPLEQLLAIDVSGYVKPYYSHGEYDGNKPRNISEILSSYAFAKLSKRNRRIGGDSLRKIEFNKLACIVHFQWHEFAWESEGK